MPEDEHPRNVVGIIGRIEPFEDTLETWTSYTERLEQYFEVNSIAEDKKVPALLTLLGGKTYTLLRNLTAPQKPKEKDYATLVDLLRNHLTPKPIVIAERFRFHKRNQHEGESVNTYMAELRKLTEFCDFGLNLNDALRDRFVCGLRNDQIQKKLLTIRELTLDKSLDIAVAMETATKDAIELRNVQSDVPVHKVQGNFRRRKQGRPQPQQAPRSCYRCNRTDHLADKCRFKDSTCNQCQKKGHIRVACRSGGQMKKPQRYNRVHALSHDDDLGIYSVYSHENENEVGNYNISHGNDSIYIKPCVNGKVIPMELDTGSSVSVISEEDYVKYFKGEKLKKSSLVLKTYSGEKLNSLGVLCVNVKYNDQEADLNLHVVKRGGPVLFGREWLKTIRLDWSMIKSLSSVREESKGDMNLKDILARRDEVFKEEIGCVKGIKAKLHLQPDAVPKFVKARPVAFALRPKVEQALNKLETEGIINPVQVSDWASPVVPVLKKDGTVRICGDFKVTLNSCLQVDQYPMPKIDDIFANLAGGQKFSKIDLRQAYLQLPMDDESMKLLTINTHKGLYQFTRLPFGVASSPAIWQRTIEQILPGLDGVQCVLDDMIVTGKSEQEHLKNLDNLLKRIQKFGLRANLDKCYFFKENVTFCGHEIGQDGLKKSQDKIDAVLKVKIPENVTELRSFLGLVQYYGKFLPNLATEARPLNELLEKTRKWKWTEQCDTAFVRIKRLVTSEQVLTHYDPTLPVRLASDASPFGLGAVLSHVMPNGSERPVMFASRSLSKSERNYAQIDKEALGIVWSVRKFYNYVFARKFTLVTDHMPLTSIFSPSRAIPATTAARLQRFALFLSGFNYDIEYKNTKRHTNVDGLSRMPVQSCEDPENVDAEDIFHISHFETLPVTSAVIARETRRDRVLSRVYDQVANGWNDANDDELLKPFFNRKSEITLHQGCLLWGIRVIVPTKLRSRIQDLLHEGHPGVVRMKAVARSYVWWPGIDGQIEQTVKRCDGCQSTQKMPQVAPLHPWEWPSAPWERVHMDFAGPFMGSMFLVLVCAHSKWPEVVQMRSTTSAKTIEVLRMIFCRTGIPKQLVSDNGPQFTSVEFENFTKQNGIKHYKSAPYHPATNGLAERFIQSFKNSMRAMKQDNKDLNHKIANFLLNYRNTPHSVTKETPAKLFMGRDLRSCLSLVRPDVKATVINSQMDSVFQRNQRPRYLNVGDRVIARDYKGKEHKWVGGEIEKCDGPLMYKVRTDLGSVWRRHVDQIKPSNISEDINITSNMPHGEDQPTVIDTSDVIQNSELINAPSNAQPARRYPERVRNPTQRLIAEI